MKKYIKKLLPSLMLMAMMTFFGCEDIHNTSPDSHDGPPQQPLN